MNTKDKTNRDNLCVLIAFCVLALVMICVMIRSFKIIDLCYFGVVVFFGIKYLLICRK